MLRRRLAAFTVAVLTVYLLAMTGCGSKEPPEAGRYYDEGRGISIRFPEGWEIIEEEDVDAVTAVAPFEGEQDMLRESISVSVEEVDDEMTVDQFSNHVNAVTAAECADYRVEQTGSITIDGVPANWIIFSYTEPHGTIMTLGYSLVKGGRGCLVTCNAEPNTYPRYAPIFEESANSLRVE